MSNRKLIVGAILTSLVVSPLQTMGLNQESKIQEIRRLYNEINENCMTKEIISEEIILYNDNDETSKNYKISYSPTGANTAYEFYFEDEKIFFVFSNSKINKINYENRYYFDDRDMIRWIDASKTTYNQDYENYNYIFQANNILSQVDAVNNLVSNLVQSSNLEQPQSTQIEMNDIIRKSFNNFNVRDNYGKYHTVYAYADNATSEIASMENNTAWAGAWEGEVVMSGDFNLAYFDMDNNKIVTYNLTNDFTLSQINVSPYYWQSIYNQYTANTDFIRIIEPASTNYAYNHMYTIKDGQICKALDGRYFGRGDLLQVDAHTFRTTSYNHGEYIYNYIVYNPKIGQFVHN